MTMPQSAAIFRAIACIAGIIPGQITTAHNAAASRPQKKLKNATPPRKRKGPASGLGAIHRPTSTAKAGNTGRI